MIKQSIFASPVLFLAVLALGACSAMQPLTEGISRESVSNAIEPGDVIIILTRTGAEELVTVSSIEDEHIVGEVSVETEHRLITETRQFRFEEIARIDPAAEAATGSAVKKTAGVVAAGGAIVGLAVVYYIIYTALVVEIVAALAL